MKIFKIFKIFIILSFCLFLIGCNTVKKGFINEKKTSSDEFLVEKKSPLVEPPEYNELPLPNLSQSKVSNQDLKVKELIVKNEETEEKVSKENVNESFEDSLIKKINKN
jgi:hypothetical protein